PTVELATIFTTAAMLRTATTDQTLLLLPWMHWLARFSRSRGRVAAVLIGTCIIVAPWFVFLATLQGNQEAPIATTTTVTLTLLGYVILYSRKWFMSRRVEKAKPLATETMD
ncbi:MAG: hypothetical protein KGJ80_15885, partial [Chloroflexota bacterium]|nr:hypothetical protein [Chloroflexota bacterium]